VRIPRAVKEFRASEIQRRHGIWRAP
jgi:hypothetical protein